MEPNIFRYIWKHSRREQLMILALILCSLPFYWMSLDVPKRIVNYVQEGDTVTQGSEFGFIKFGSRVDLFLPLDAKIEVDMGQKVKGNKTIIARL